VVNAIAHIDVKASMLTKERFIAGGAAAVSVASGVVLGKRLRFHNHAPQHLAIVLALHQRQPIRSGATCSAGRAKKDGGRCWEGVVAMGVAWGMGGNKCYLI